MSFGLSADARWGGGFAPFFLIFELWWYFRGKKIEVNCGQEINISKQNKEIDMNGLLKRYSAALEEVKKLKEELADLKENNVLVPKYWYIDEDTEEKVYDTDEMESAFHDAMVDLGAYGDELRCMKCDKQFGKTESSFPNKDGDAVCADCLIDEEE